MSSVFIIEKQFIGNTTVWWWWWWSCVQQSNVFSIVQRFISHFIPNFWFWIGDWFGAIIICLDHNWCNWSAKRFFFHYFVMSEKWWVTMFRFLDLNCGVWCWRFFLIITLVSHVHTMMMVTSISWFCVHFYRNSMFVWPFSLAAYDVSSNVPIAPIPPLSLCDVRENRGYPINMRSLVPVINLKKWIHKTETEHQQLHKKKYGIGNDFGFS